MEWLMRDKCDIYLKILLKENTDFYNTALELLGDKEELNTLYKTNILAVAPILYTYIHWVLEEAKNRNIKRLYFLARDGYIMKKIADRICKQDSYNIECRYLYCSRIAWRIPQYHIEQEKCIDKICINSVGVNIDKIFDRANLSDEEKDEICNLLQISDDERYKHLQWYEVVQLKDTLSSCDTFMNYVYSHSKAAFDTAIGYLKQEGLFQDLEYALVDTGWTGSMQASLAALLNGRKLQGFYFGMYNYPKDIGEDGYHTFFFSKNTNMRNKVFFNNNLFECLCSSPDGMTIGYKKTDDGYVPIFAGEKNINTNIWDIELHINTIVEFTDNVSKLSSNNSFDYKRGNRLVFNLCKQLMTYPTFDEAICYGDFRFSDDITEKDINKLAADMTLGQIKQNLLLWRVANRFKIGKFNVPYKQSCWIDASIMKCKGINHRKYIRHILMFRLVQYLSMRILKKY
jgi:predicted HAD superfamily hydrolase